MTTSNNTRTHKHIVALFAAGIMTIMIAAVMLAFGVNAILNPNGITIAQAAGPDSAINSGGDATAQTTIDQLQAQISEYQSREAQYQNEIQNAADQINQLSQQNQQYQALLNALQNAGVIQITSDGRVFLPNAFSSAFQRRGDGN